MAHRKLTSLRGRYWPTDEATEKAEGEAAQGPASRSSGARSSSCPARVVAPISETRPVIQLERGKPPARDSEWPGAHRLSHLRPAALRGHQPGRASAFPGGATLITELSPRTKRDAVVQTSLLKNNNKSESTVASSTG